MQRAVLMGDPSHFSVKGGANPHTRTRLGLRRRVDRGKAIRQWHAFHDLLRDLGVRIVLVPPHPEQPGLVYPANAGFLSDLDAEKPVSEKTFHLSNLIATRAGERNHYRQVLAYAGFRVATIDERYRFEGEADFFPAGDFYLFCHGRIVRQRFVPALALPPWRRVYGFRTDLRVEPLLAQIVQPKPVLRIELTLEAHYHGDTALCAFGPGRRHLMVYKRALAEESFARLRETFGERLLELGEDDARRYAANSFALHQEGEHHLLMPEGVSDALRDQVRERGATPQLVDVSEFLKKGGGSVKCMIGDLGPVRTGRIPGSYRTAQGGTAGR
jgi:N-dimethylarginine dimethylaminohydrolase